MTLMRTSYFVVASGVSSFLCACSVHPLPEDVARSTTYDIVQRIRCEARRAILDYALHDGAQKLLQHIAHRDKVSLYTLSRAQFAEAAELLKRDKEIIGRFRSRLSRRVDGAARSEAKFQAKINELTDKINKITGDDLAPEGGALGPDPRLQDPGIPEAAPDAAPDMEQELLREQNKDPTFAEQAPPARLKKRKITPEEQKRVDILKAERKSVERKRDAAERDAEIERKLKSNSAYKLLKQHKETSLLRDEFLPAAIGFDFKFSITQNKDSSTDATLSLPFSNGNFSLGLKLGNDKQQKSDRSFDVVEYFVELIIDDNLKLCDDVENITYPITGNVGLAEVVHTYYKLTTLGPGLRRKGLGASDSPGRRTETDRDSGQGGSGSGGDGGTPSGGGRSGVNPGNVADFIDTLTFTTSFSGSVNPRLRIDPVLDRFRLTDMAVNLGGERKDEHRVTIGMSSSYADIEVPDAQIGAARALFRMASDSFGEDEFVVDDPKARVRSNLRRRRDLDILREGGIVE